MRKILMGGFLLVFAFLLIAPTFSADAAGDQYRRWLDDGKTYECIDDGVSITVSISQQNVEFNNLPADAEYTINDIDNGVLVNTDGPYVVEQTSGTLNYGDFATGFISYPLTYEMRIDTLIDGIVVYQSSLIVNCSADATGSLTPVNVVPTGYRRWLDDGKTFECAFAGDGIQVTLSNQNVEFFNLLPDDEFTINYIENGVVTTDGPYVVEQTSGTRNYNQFSIDFIGYPLTFEFRLDTLRDGVVIYQSSVSVTCTADGVFPVTPVNVIPGEATAATGGCPSPLNSMAVQGRMLETVTAFASANAAATTDVVIPVGTAWWITAASNGYYRIWIACFASQVWVPASSMGPNYDTGGAPLPDTGA